MACLLPTPSLWRPDAAVLTVLLFRASDAVTSASSPTQTGGRNAAPFAAISGSVSRSSNPSTATYCGVAHLFLTGMSASLADQHQTDETFRPDWSDPSAGSSGVLRS